eukprot:1341068-Amorphochlora_amoeboformis.AAC.3
MEQQGPRSVILSGILLAMQLCSATYAPDSLARFFPPSGKLPKPRQEKIAFYFRRLRERKTSQDRRRDFRAITFDLDDTIWKGTETLINANEKMHDWIKVNTPKCAEKYDSKNFRELMSTLRKSQPEIAHNFTALRKKALEIAFAETGYDKSKVEPAFTAFIKARNNVLLYEDSVQTLKCLRERGIIVGAITNGNANVWEICGLRDLFDFAIKAEDAGEAKPLRAPFTLALRCCRRVLEDIGETSVLSIGESNILHVGDSIQSDVDGAKNAGFYAILLDRQIREEEKANLKRDSKADCVITGLEELYSKL